MHLVKSSNSKIKLLSCFSHQNSVFYSKDTTFLLFQKNLPCTYQSVCVCVYVCEGRRSAHTLLHFGLEKKLYSRALPKNVHTDLPYLLS